MDAMGYIAVDIGESLQITFGVSGRHACMCLGFRSKGSYAGAQILGWLIKPSGYQGVWLHLCPLKATQCSIDIDAQVIFFPRSYLGDMHYPFGAVIETK